MLSSDPTDRNLGQTLAELTIWEAGNEYKNAGGKWTPEVAKKYAKGLAMVEALLKEDFQQPRLWKIYADALSAAEEVTAEQLAMALKIAAGNPHEAFDDPKQSKDALADQEVVYASRLAGVLLRQSEKAEKADEDQAVVAQLKAAALPLLDKALGLNSTGKASRVELAGVLALGAKLDPKYTKDSVKLLSNLKLDPADRFKLIDNFSAAGDFTRAIQECLALLRDDPSQTQAKVMLAKLTLWSGDSATARPHDRSARTEFQPG